MELIKNPESACAKELNKFITDVCNELHKKAVAATVKLIIMVLTLLYKKVKEIFNAA